MQSAPVAPRARPQGEPPAPPLFELPPAANALPLQCNGSLREGATATAGSIVSAQMGLAGPYSRPALKAAWTPGMIKAVSAEISAMQLEIQRSEPDQMRKSSIDRLLHMILLQVQTLYPELRNLQSEMKAQAGDLMGNALASRFLAQLARLVANADAYLESELGRDTSHMKESRTG